jgi:hypothetical protein
MAFECDTAQFSRPTNRALSDGHKTALHLLVQLIHSFLIVFSHRLLLLPSSYSMHVNVTQKISLGVCISSNNQSGRPVCYLRAAQRRSALAIFSLMGRDTEQRACAMREMSDRYGLSHPLITQPVVPPSHVCFICKI